MMRIWDTFLLRDELDMLECRLIQFQDFPVWRHVLVEAPVDHQGHPKPLYYAENQERFAPWADQIVHIVAEELAGMGPPSPLAEHAWAREAAQRNAIGRGLADAADDDWLILADVDEIPNGAVFAAIAAGQVSTLVMKCCVFYADLLWDDLRTSVVTFAGLARAKESLSQTRRQLWCTGQAVPGAGHHLTWMGGQDAVRAKLAAHCHTEDNGEIESAIDGDRHWRHGANPFRRHGYDGPLRAVDIDASWPRWVWERQCPASWFRPRE